MSGMHDGVSKVWRLTINRGLNLDGYKSDEDMLQALLYRVLGDGYKEPETAIARVRAMVDKAEAQFRRDYDCEIIP